MSHRTIHHVALTLVLTCLPSLAAAQSAPAREGEEDEPRGGLGETVSQQRLPNGEYVAPMQQFTQPSYVPQSVAMSGPEELDDWSEGEPIPPGYHVVKRRRNDLVIAGAVVLGGLYLFSAVGNAVSQQSSYSDKSPALYFPVFGPIAALASGNNSPLAVVGLVIDSLGQLAGTGMLIGGLASKRSELRRNDLARLQLTPTFANGGSGLALSGTF